MTEHLEIDSLFGKARRWRREADKLREVLIECDLNEELKWRKPCYVHGGKNICIMQRMNDFLALLFFKGALLKDPDNILEVQGPNSRAGFRICFTSIEDIERMSGSIKAYVREAIEVEKAGLRVARATNFEFPEELLDKFGVDPDFRVAFEGLTLGRQRAYNLYFSAAKQSKTRRSRIERYRTRILEGRAIHDR